MTADEYLIIPDAYSLSENGMRWSPRFDAIENWSGKTFILVEQLGQILEGVFASPTRVPHFAHVLHLVVTSFPLLDAARRRSRGPSLDRHFGVLIAKLCECVPSVAAPPQWGAVSLALKRRLLFPELEGSTTRERGHVKQEVLQRAVTETLRDFGEETLVHWLKFGCCPIAQDPRLTEAILDAPLKTPSLTTLLRQNPRLAGAAALAPALDGAMSLPPRRHRPDQLSLGGYASVTTRGPPERLLLSQFALDSSDFIRRFAENELLYYRREEPHVGERPTRVLVLDQGVRTWGGVRLALAGAVIAAIGKDRRKAGPLSLALTSTARPLFDPSAIPADELIQLLEASDLTPHPSECLRNAVVDECRLPRDVLLLTHPRCLNEPSLRDAMKSTRPGDRLFGLTVNEHGEAELGEWRGNAIVRLRSFRVDLSGADFQLSIPLPASPDELPAWTGAIETDAYPFRPGMLGRPQRLAFDAAGKKLLVAAPDGLLHLAHLDDRAPEILPRAAMQGASFTEVDSILGTVDGFAVCGRMTVPQDGVRFQFDSATVPRDSRTAHVLAHYDCVRRHVRLHTIGPVGGPLPTWTCLPDLHCVVVVDKISGYVLDLATGTRFRGDANPVAFDDRCSDAWMRYHKDPYRFTSASVVVLPPPTNTSALRHPWIKVGTGVVWGANLSRPCPPFIPLADGERIFAEAAVSQATCAGDTLVLVATRKNKKPKLYLFSLPSGEMRSEHPSPIACPVHVLSNDGGLLALQAGQRRVEIFKSALGVSPITTVRWAAIDMNVRVEVSPRELVIHSSRFTHAFSVSNSRLHHEMRTTAPEVRPRTINSSGGVTISASGHRSLPITTSWTAWVQRCGQVILRDHDNMAVAHVLVRRTQAAVVLPDGTRWGSPELLGGPPTLGAAERIGQALEAVGLGS